VSSIASTRYLLPVSTEDASLPEDPDELFRNLGTRFRACNLVCELDIDEAMQAQLVAAMQALAQRRVADDAHALRWHRALVTTYLVAEGIVAATATRSNP
jgi:hypothetical protein